MMKWQSRRIGDFIHRVKDPVTVEDWVEYKQVTIRMNYKGVVLRGLKKGCDIKTKNQWRVRSGLFILSRIDARNGAFGIIPEELEGAIVSNDFLAYEIDLAEVDIEFFNSFLQSPIFLEACIKASRGNTNRKRVNESFFLDYEVGLPTLSEQQRLIRRINEAKDCISVANKEISHQETLLIKLKQAILQEAIQGRLTVDWRKENSDVEPASQLLERIQKEKQRLIVEKKIRKEKPQPPITSEEIPFKIPETWQWCRLGEVVYDTSYGTSQKAYSEPIGVPVLRMGNISSDGAILYSDLKYVNPYIKDLPKLYLEDGDILFNRTNSYELVGKSGVHRNSNAFTYASYLIRLRMLCALYPEYVSGYINSITCRKKFIEPNLIQQNGQANFNGTKLKKVLIPLPPFPEQAAIVERTESLMDSCRQLETEIKHSRTHAENLLQTVLKEAFTAT